MMNNTIGRFFECGQRKNVQKLKKNFVKNSKC